MIDRGPPEINMGIDVNLTFKSLNIALLTVSDTRTLDTDTSGDLLAARIEAAGHRLVGRTIITDDIAKVQAQVKQWSADPAIDAIISTGGTGLTGRDITPEAVRPLFDKEIDGFSVIFHQVSFGTVGLATLQSRALAGVVQGTIVFCLPGSNGAVKDGWDNIIVFELDSRHMPCNLVDLIPRFMER